LVFLITNKAKAVGSEGALQAIQEAENIIKEMQVMGFGITYANDTLNEAKNLFDKGYYEASESLAEKVLEIREKAIEVDELINQVETRIYELSSKGYDTSDASKVFDSGFSEFIIDNYLDAEKLMREALNRLDEIEAGESLKRTQEMGFDVLSIVLDYLWLLIILFLFILIVGLKVKEKVDIKNWKKEMENLKKEMENLKKSLSEAQRKYFKEGSISKMDYELISKRYNHRISLIKRRISVLDGKFKDH